MITYVNTVLVSNLNSGAIVSAMPSAVASFNSVSTDAGKFVIVDKDNTVITTAAAAQAADAIKIGIVTNKNAVQVNAAGVRSYIPIIKWSNIITKDSIKSATYTAYAADTEDKVYINFKGLSAGLKTKFAEGGKRIIVRLTFKDLPTRFRKWTESYEYVTKAGDDEKTIAQGIATLINKEWKRARVVATAKAASAATASATFSAGTTSTQDSIELEAMPYDDDDAVDSLNWANKGRFNVNIYYTDPAAEGWESTNKNFPTGVIITKVPGKNHVGSPKLVRDREAQAMGYQGILNRGEGTWPVIKPEMQTKLNGQYDVYTIEFERMYRAADDIFRKTKETVELYCEDGGMDSAVKAILDGFVAGVEGRVSTLETTVAAL